MKLKRLRVFIHALLIMVLLWFGRHHIRFTLWTGVTPNRVAAVIASREPFGFGTMERWVKFKASSVQIERMVKSKSMLSVTPDIPWYRAPNFLDYTIGGHDISSNYMSKGLDKFDPIPRDLRVYFMTTNEERFTVGWGLYYSPTSSTGVWESIKF